MFVDHLIIDDQPLLFRYQSILIPMSMLLFENHGRTIREVRANSPISGEMLTVQVPVMSELGTLVTKCDCMSNPKRPRDAFDVFLAITQARDRDELANTVSENCLEDRLENLWQLVTQQEYRQRIEKYWPGASDDATWALKVKLISSFLDDAGIENPTTG